MKLFQTGLHVIVAAELEESKAFRLAAAFLAAMPDRCRFQACKMPSD